MERVGNRLLEGGKSFPALFGTLDKKSYLGGESAEQNAPLSLSLSLSLSLLSLSPSLFLSCPSGAERGRGGGGGGKKGGEIPFRNGKWCYCRCRGGKQEKRVTGTAVVSRRPWPISKPPRILQ